MRNLVLILLLGLCLPCVAQHGPGFQNIDLQAHQIAYGLNGLHLEIGYRNHRNARFFLAAKAGFDDLGLVVDRPRTIYPAQQGTISPQEVESPTEARYRSGSLSLGGVVNLFTIKEVLYPNFAFGGIAKYEALTTDFPGSEAIGLGYGAYGSLELEILPGQKFAFVLSAQTEILAQSLLLSDAVIVLIPRLGGGIRFTL